MNKLGLHNKVSILWVLDCIGLEDKGADELARKRAGKLLYGSEPFYEGDNGSNTYMKRNG